MTQTFKIATWNVNSIRIRVKQLEEWLQLHDIDILLMQEIKCMEEQFPLNELEHLGYNIYIKGQKSYNGVAIMSKIAADEVKYDFPDNPCSDEARYIEVSLNLPIGYTRLASVYVPNGGEVNSDKFTKKLKFLEKFNIYLQETHSRDENIILGGDFNVAPDNIDVYNSKILADQTCFTNIERNLIRSITSSGYSDFYKIIYPNKQEFTWWDYRAGSFPADKGMRIDYFIGNAISTNFLKDVVIDKLERAKEKASDHAPVIAMFSGF